MTSKEKIRNNDMKNKIIKEIDGLLRKADEGELLQWGEHLPRDIKTAGCVGAHSALLIVKEKLINILSLTNED